jgi:hypothetical protein
VPEFDEYLLGWRDRDLVADAEHASRINRGGGWLHPVVLDDGRAAGTWGREGQGDGTRIVVDAFARKIPARLRRSIEEEATDIGRFLGRRVRAAY